MKLTFVQNEKEKAESDRVIRAGLSLKKAKVGTWILPPARSKDGKFTVIDSPTGKDVYVGSFDTIDGALLYALGIRDSDGNAVHVWDRHDALKDWGSFVWSSRIS